MADPTQHYGHIEFINDQEREYFAQAMLGEEIRDFLNSNTGRFLHGCAKQKYDQCVKEMFELDPYTPEGKKCHAALKQDAWCAQHFMQWCVEAILEGEQAATQLEHYRDDL